MFPLMLYVASFLFGSYNIYIYNICIYIYNIQGNSTLELLLKF